MKREFFRPPKFSPYFRKVMIGVAIGLAACFLAAKIVELQTGKPYWKLLEDSRRLSPRQRD